ncbi:MAG: sulfite exporter TauE/SafE family protein, partial [Betaproteobacteria bacterium]|nr:sulfite exporter TauE/SafE family protein [Betaproteobacteria bacterium]
MKSLSLILALWLLALRVCAADFLPVEQAFRVQVTRDAQGAAWAQWDIAPGYKLYRRSLHVTVAGGDAQLAPVVLPPGLIVHDDNFNEDVEIYHGRLRVPLALSPAAAGALLKVQYQGCAEAGLCYPPQTQQLTLAAAVSSAAAPPALPATPATAPATESGRLQQLLQAGPTLQLILAFVAFGLLLAFTPCVLPMLPILASLIVGNGSAPGRGRALALSLAYSLGMALVYTLFGVAAGLAGEGLAGALQQPPVLIGFALLLTLLALSQFDLYTLQLPGGFMERITHASNRLRGGSLAPVFLMGGLSALMVGPC